jgi:HD-GYP domain-containing protein (c-di-GMP phosphodiesterase class II)
LLPAVPGIRHHHERWDGRGYPDGLAGNDIPLAARIIAVADAYDAMTSNRTYRQALSREQALKRIIAGAGSKYDPQVVNAFQAAWHMDGIGNELSTS